MENLLLKKFGKNLSQEEIDYLYKIDRIQEIIPGRIKSALTFRNNLEGQDCRIKYIKLGHVIEGHDVFVYERTNIDKGSAILFDNYVIGGAIGHVTGTHGNIPEAKAINEKGKKDLDNLYDRLYVQFVLEKKVGNEIKEIVYNQSYDQFLKREFMDIFALKEGKVNLEAFNIQLYFDPKLNKVDGSTIKDKLRLKLSVSVPTDYEIDTDSYVL